MNTDHYPLNCLDDTGDGFSGWFAISNVRQCNDFCYWQKRQTNNEHDELHDYYDYTASNTADPHQVTAIIASKSTYDNNSISSISQQSSFYWVCIYNAASDSFLSSNMTIKSVPWIDYVQRLVLPSDEVILYNTSNNYPRSVNSNNYDVINTAPFMYLKCQKGAGEKLTSWDEELVKSAQFWTFGILLSFGIILVEIQLILWNCCKGRTKYRKIGTDIHSAENDPSRDIAAASNDDTTQKTELQCFHEEEISLHPKQFEDECTSSSMCGQNLLSLRKHSKLPQRQKHQRQQLLRTYTRNMYSTTTRTTSCIRTTLNTITTAHGGKKLQFSLKTLSRILGLLLLNAILAFAMTLSSISLMEIKSNPLFHESLEGMTPACLNPNLVCSLGNEDIDNVSIPWEKKISSIVSPGIANSSETNILDQHALEDMVDSNANGASLVTSSSTSNNKASVLLEENLHQLQSFSYLVASDAQLYWFNGEFAEMGTKNLPPTCAPSDSCGECTRKHGYHTNHRLRGAWESLMTGKSNLRRKHRAQRKLENKTTVEDEYISPIPDTLIMNGDLTAYFHPHEKRAYDSIYRDIGGLKYYFPSLGNHDMEHIGGGKYGGDQWNGPPNCNAHHAIGYLKSGFCGGIPHFHAERLVRYDASSLAYSWEEGRFHFVHTHYYPTYEMASMVYRSSVKWLDRDLQLAYEAGLSTVLFVHAVNYFIPALEKVILGKNVVAIFAGHDHRCLHRKCQGLYPIKEDEVESLDLSQVKKCIPAAYDTCQLLNGENLVFVEDMNVNVSMPKKKLKNVNRTDKPLCPKAAPFYINETDNSLLCRKVTYNHPDFPAYTGEDNNNRTSIPIFWSGSSSFETFLKVDFFDDRLVINAMTVQEDGSAARYIDVFSVPNVRHPYHLTSDIEEVIINL